MLHIKHWYSKPEEITVDNYFKQSFDVYNDNDLVAVIHEGDCSMHEIELYFQGKIEEALAFTLNNRVLYGLSALDKLLKLHLEVSDYVKEDLKNLELWLEPILNG